MVDKGYTFLFYKQLISGLTSQVHCKNKNSGKPPSSVYTEEKFRMENPDFRVDIQSSFVR